MSNLTVSYVSQTPAAKPAGSNAADPADSPLGFLAALLDQILGGDARPQTSAQAGASATVPGLLDVDFGSGMQVAREPSDLVASISAQLDKLDAGGGDDQLSDAIDALIAALDAAPSQPDAIASTDASVAAPTPPTTEVNQLLAQLGLIDPAGKTQPVTTTAEAAPPADTGALRDRLLALSQSVAATAPDLAQKLQTLAAKLEPIAADPALAAPQADPDALTIAEIIRSLLGRSTPTSDSDEDKPLDPTAASPAPQVSDQLLQVLASLGLSTTPAVSTTSPATTETAATTGTSAVPPPLVHLSTQLSQVASELGATAPDLAKKLEAVATRLVSADADPALLAKLTGAAGDLDGTALDKLVQTLIEPRPATAPTAVPPAPQIAAPKDLTLPAPLAPKQSKSAVTEVKAAPPEPTSVTADSAPAKTGVTLTATAAPAPADPSPEPRPDTKVAAVVADTTKADPAAQTAPPPQQPAPLAAQQARALPAAYQPVANPINMGQVAFEMVRQAHQGTSRFTIRLDPPELGRVDVKMHVDNTGTVNARLTVDRAETLDLFQRDRQSLERALSQAGLDASKTNLEFNLRQQSHNPFSGMMGGDQRQQQHGNYGGASRFGLAGTDEVTAMPAVTLYRGTASAAGVNIFA